MRGWLIRTGVKRSFTDVRYVTPVAPGAAVGLVADVYRQVEREFGILAPPLALHSPDPQVLAACWAMLRATLVADGHLERAEKEAIAAAVSLGNSCPYCVEVHTTVLAGFGGGEAAQLISAGRLDAVPSARLRALAEWGRHSGSVGGPALPATGSSAADAEAIGVAVTFHLLNRMVNVFLGSSPIPAAAPAPVQHTIRRLLGQVMRAVAERGGDPSRSPLLPPAPLPADLGWAAPAPLIADAFGRAAAAIEAAGVRSVPAPVRDHVTTGLAGWDGQSFGLSRAWADQAVRELPVEHRPLGRFVQLVAFAAYQVDETVVEPARSSAGGDEALIGVAGWVSWRAARRIASWLSRSVPPLPR
ncbi:carboxymuconolactone decarboxylase family protein [Solwaraspora sp. WMMD406]|uniref:carboxymuconolactone decarboxylase family protein n=1 Tax=Solwaraspora sp. WMMD406 TaxID=3016095 RepID=UPI0024163E9E|nr:carboxymuconolactone decarboxylase family protein [Solwaraspora sp. WMMD406]MDG4764709.1 carboxymuconolactone decarboxylase family protein [Solwaraspora sp. WMMD406]